MSNEEYMKLYEQFKPMIIKLVNKWSRIGVIEYDDLMQIALLALIHAQKYKVLYREVNEIELKGSEVEAVTKASIYKMEKLVVMCTILLSIE